MRDTSKILAREFAPAWGGRGVPIDPLHYKLDAAWRKAEADLSLGQPGDLRAGNQPFEDYVKKQWLPNHVVEPTTMQSYRYGLSRHILPWFGRMRMSDILPIHVRE